MVAEAVADMQVSGEPIPKPLAEKHYSGEFRVRIPPRGTPRLGACRRQSKASA